MGRPLKRRKQRSSGSGGKVRRRTKDPYAISFANVHPLVKKNWDRKLTLRQNYERMGLMVALNGKAGGEAEMKSSLHDDHPEDEHEGHDDDDEDEDEMGDDDGEEPLVVEYRSYEDFEAMDTVTRRSAAGGSREDEEAFSHLLSKEELEHGIEGHIAVDDRVKKIGTKLGARNASAKRAAVTSTKRKVDPLPVSVVGALKAEADLGEAPRERWASEQEEQVYGKLKRKYRDDYEAMARDRKLNTYQLTAGQLRRKMSKPSKSTK